MTTTPRGPERCCLVLMFKAPHGSKRRLGALGPAAARHLFTCAAEDLAAWPGPTCFAPAGPDDARWLAAQDAAEASVVEQRGANLGERIEHVGARLAAAGHERQLFIGIDCPELGAATLTDAAMRLDAGASAVLAPAADGGVVLMGTRARWPGLGDLPWSTAELHAALARRLRADGRDVATLATLADVDSLEDLAALAPRLAADARPARRALAAWLTSHGPRPRIEA